MSELLSPNQYLDGPATITSWARPMRAAYVIPLGRVDLAMRAIVSSSLTWGGADHAFIPYDGGLSREWLEVIERYDPDHLVDLAGMPSETRDELQATGRFVHDWPSPLDTFFTPGALLHSAANAFLDKAKAEELVVTVPKIDDNHPLRLQILAAYGILDERDIEGTLRDDGLNPSLRLADPVGLSDGSCDDGLGALLTPPIPVSWPSGGPRRVLTVLQLTVDWVPRYPPPQYMGNLADFEFDEPIEQHANPVVVTGEPASVSDLCLYWTIRATRPRYAWPFPLWIPLPYLRGDEAGNVLDSLVTRLAPRLSAPFGETPVVHVLSTTASRQRIQATLKTSVPLRIHTANFAKFIPRAFRRGFKEQYELVFRRGRAQVRRPSEQRINYFGHFDRVVQEVEVAGWRLPQAKALRHGVLGVPWRITPTGYATWFYPQYEQTLAGLHLPSSWRALEALFEDSGYSCAPSDKGLLAVGILGLAGSVDRLAILASSSTFETLASMAQAEGRQSFLRALRKIQPALAAHEVDGLERAVQEALGASHQTRTGLAYGEFARMLGDAAKPVLQWLLSHKVVFRGAELRCPNCQMRRWYPIDRIGGDFQCDGCQRVSPSPLAPDSTSWQFRLNELYARAYDQGALVHLLLAFQRSRQRSGMEEERSPLGFYPGVSVSRMDSGETVAELDYVEIKEGRLIVGECKVDGRYLEPTQADRLVTLANQINSSRVVLATATNFPTTLVARLRSSLTCKVDVLGGQDLFDETPWGWRGHQSCDASEIPSEYLKHLSGWFFGIDEGRT